MPKSRSTRGRSQTSESKGPTERACGDRSRDAGARGEVGLLAPALHSHRDQRALLDQLGDARRGVLGRNAEVVAQVALGGDAQRRRGDLQKSALRLLDRRRRGVDHRPRQHPLGHVVVPDEADAPRGGDAPAPEEELERALDVGPVPPGSFLARPLLELRRRHRATRAHLLDQAGRATRAARWRSAASRPTRRPTRAPSASAAAAASPRGSATPRAPSTRTAAAARSGRACRSRHGRTARAARTAAGSAPARGH